MSNSYPVVTRYSKDKLPEMPKVQAFKELIDQKITFDYALPQTHLDLMVLESGLPYGLVLSTTVWAYPPSDFRFMGCPVSYCIEVQAAWDAYFRGTL